ncbi:MAG: aminodeoxychorismate/anthranilate synthase component II [Saprospiraceae bacterium]|nr:aminodeoxychorismate/anthranilate synthase component II [Saprospiraceae bacterium]
MKILLLDNYDSFTYNLYDYLLRTGVACEVLRNDALSLPAFEAAGYDAVVFSPGPKRPADAGIMMSLIEHFHDRLPMLGICLGHQALGEFFGARLVKASIPMHGKTTDVRHEGHTLFAGLPACFTVMRYHSLILDSLGHTPLECIARTDAGEIMALAHRHLPLTGVQFHPESILTQHGLPLLKNWVRSIATTGTVANDCPVPQLIV